jgi:hypothetical protein
LYFELHPGILDQKFVKKAKVDVSDPMIQKSNVAFVALQFELYVL